jgi:tetratricopeptide (TPR) repeat protein
VEEAITEFRAALRLRPDDPTAHYDLGIALLGAGQVETAIAEFRAAVRLRPDAAAFYIGLGTALQGSGEFTEALTVLRKGSQLGVGQPGWPSTSDKWIRDVARMAALESRLPALQRGEDRPADPAEALGFARLCTCKGLHAVAARLYQETFAQQPEWADDLASAIRYSAASAAALAGTGCCKDHPPLDEAARAAWRKQALEWLQADLLLRAKQLESGTAEARNEVRQKLQYWLRDPALAGLRDQAMMAQLPEADRGVCHNLWDRVSALLRDLDDARNLSQR